MLDYVEFEFSFEEPPNCSPVCYVKGFRLKIKHFKSAALGNFTDANKEFKKLTNTYT